MSSYIDKNKALEIFKAERKNPKSISPAFYAGYLYAVNVFKSIEPEEAEPVIHAKWIYLGKGGDSSWQIDGRGQSWDIWECSNCKCKSCGSPQPKRCPHCDAKMDLEEDK